MEHVPVLLDEALSLLKVREGGTYVDLTLGRGGHSRAILERIGNGILYAFDVDPSAIRESRKRLTETGARFELIEANFASVKEELGSRGVDSVDGIIMDLGVSSPDFDDPTRGFSYSKEGPLDMRMDPFLGLSAYDVVNSYSEKELVEILRDYGEEREARQIARAIVRSRESKPIGTTLELAGIVASSKSPRERSKKGHPAKQAFQAIRIEVNHELAVLEKVLEDIPSLLKEGGVAAVISFHSLEDRLVKKRFREVSRPRPSSRIDPSSYLRKEEEVAFLDLTPHPIVPSEEEKERNPRSASAKLRAIERKEKKP